MDGLLAAEWIERCMTRLVAADPGIGEDESLELAIDLFQFERTAAMAPETAVDFAVQEMASAAPCFDRRRQAR
jgi:hypothetical protein